MTVFQRLRILPLLVLVAFLSFVVRVGDFAHSLKDMGTAYARDEAREVHDAQPPAMTEAGHGNETQAADAGGDMGHDLLTDSHDSMADLPDAPAEKIDWQDPVDTDFAYSHVQKELYQDLMTRREDLKKREAALATREALLTAAERELSQKTRELENVRNEIQSLLEEQSAAEEARITSLVKIYEGMKAKDAARIFNTLEMTVLLDVMGRMSERKSAPILAAMSPERARTVTILLAQQKQLPSLSAQ